MKIEVSSDDNSSFDESQSNDSSETNKSLNIFAEINNFPTQIICLEKLDNTLDSLMEDEEYELTKAEWASCLFQIIMTLIVYQNIFDFTHNDLHTNNIMFIKTDKKFLNYKYKGEYYKVPTFGRIFKIIDFGRSIYKYSGQQMCSDSFFKNGDAAGQFNFYKFENTKKEKILPNKGFDLCRLACSIYDNFVDVDLDEIDKKNPIAVLINKWIKDDNNKNILYKSNGEERYPDFKLYKMITRKYTKNTPDMALKESLFNSYKSSKKKIGKKAKIMNIDEYPKLF